MAENINNLIPIGATKSIDLSNGASQYALSVNFDIDKFFNAYMVGPNRASMETYSPVVQKKLGDDQQNNIQISGQFRTNFLPDESNENSGYSYITVRNNSIGKAIAHGGFGIAWRPSTGEAGVSALAGDYNGATGVLSLTSFSDGTTITDFELNAVNSRIGYINNLPFTYSGVDGETLTGVTLNSSALEEMTKPVAGRQVTLSAHNILVVDNDFVGSDLYVGRYKEFSGGALSFVNSSVAEILPNTTYYFNIIIGAENDIQLRIDSDSTQVDNSAPVITAGARTPIHEFLGTENMNAFAISVVDTTGAKWYYDNIRIGSLDSEYPLSIFSMDVSKLTSNVFAEFRAFGQGYSAGNTLEYGVDLYAWKSSTSEWVFLGGNVSSTLLESNTPVESELINVSDYESDNRIKFMLKPIGASGTLSGMDSHLEVDYFIVKSAQAATTKIGGAVDVYIEDTHLIKATETFSPDTSTFMNKFGVGRAVVWVDKVYFESNPNLILTENIDYTLAWNDDDFKGSVKVIDYIRVANGISSDLSIDYYYSPIVASAQDLVTNDPRVAYKGQDVLIKHMDINVIVLRATSSSHSYNELNVLLKSYLRSLYLNQQRGYFLGWEGLYTYFLDNSVLDLEGMELLRIYRVDGLLKTKLIITGGQSFFVDRTQTFVASGLIDD